MSNRRLALVTGAAGGIGAEVARRLSARGYTVVAIERDDALADRAVASLGAHAIAVGCDLADRVALRELTARIEGEWAADLEIVICNAGVVIPGDVADTTPEALDLQLDVMLSSATHLISSAARVFRAKDSGHILATVSTGGLIALPGSAAYSAAKAGLRAYLAALYAELRTTNVAVSGIYPSAVDTAMLYHEATHDGSLLNFVGVVSSVEAVADRFDKALHSKKLEVYIPYSDSILCRVAESFPTVLPRLLPVLERVGKRGRARYLAKTAHARSH